MKHETLSPTLLSKLSRRKELTLLAQLDTQKVRVWTAMMVARVAVRATAALSMIV